MTQEGVVDASEYALQALRAGRLRLFHVVGQSMRPTLEPDDLVLVDPAVTTPRVGAVVALASSTNGVLIKRVASATRTTFSVSSDNPLEGTDSRSLGSFPHRALIGIAVWRVTASSIIPL
ncbi:MAG: S24/S26 family peptidase [Myxococcota bacterium]